MLKPNGRIDNVSTLYNSNPTMQVLGEIIPDWLEDPEVWRDITSVLNAHRDKARRKNRGPFIKDIAIDVFNLGVIYGKREERKRRRRSKAS